jgi:hypothetical protein
MDDIQDVGSLLLHRRDPTRLRGNQRCQKARGLSKWRARKPSSCTMLAAPAAATSRLAGMPGDARLLTETARQATRSNAPGIRSSIILRDLRGRGVVVHAGAD